MKPGLLVSWLILSGFVLRIAEEAPPIGRASFQLARADTDTVAQKIAVVTGDSLVGTVENDEAIQFFVGHVTGKQDSTYLSADWAKRYVSRDQVLFIGDVLIVDKGDSLNADTLFYDEINKIGRATGRVRLADGEVVANAPVGNYFIEEKRALFPNGLRLVDSSAVITGDAGAYWTKEKRAEISGDVRLEAELTVLEADSLTYYRSSEVSVARGDVFMERLGGEDDLPGDSALRTIVFGSWARSDEPNGYSQIRGRPLLIQLRQDSTEVDTLAIRAERLDILEQGAQRQMTAAGTVRYWQTNLAAIADSMVYARRGERQVDEAESLPDWSEQVGFSPPVDSASGPSEDIMLFGSPMLWVEDTQVSGDTIRLVAHRGEIETLNVWGNAFLAQRDTLLDRINQVRGHTLTASFADDSLRIFVVRPNAEVIYYQRDEEDQADGALRVSGDEAILRLRGNDPEKLTFGEHQGMYYPESVLPTPFELDGFRWAPERRPVRTILFSSERALQWLRASQDNGQ